MNNEPPLSSVMNEVLSILSGYLNPTVGSLPTPTVSLVSADKKNPSIGNRIGTDSRGSFPTVAIKAGHLKATVQFQIWDVNPEDIEIEMNDLQGRLLADRDLLRTQGFIKFKSLQTAASELINNLNTWRKTAVFDLLYEYQYQSNDDALSIIHQIPIASDLNQSQANRENTLLTDTMQRWDDEAANSLAIGRQKSSGTRISALNLVAHIPLAWNGNPVIIERIQTGNITPPNSYPTLDDFIDAITSDSADTNAQITFASLTNFLNALDISGAPFTLGDWDQDNIPDQYQAYQKRLTRPLLLKQANDLFRIRYQAAPFDSKAVVYLRAQIN